MLARCKRPLQIWRPVFIFARKKQKEQACANASCACSSVCRLDRHRRGVMVGVAVDVRRLVHGRRHDRRAVAEVPIVGDSIAPSDRRRERRGRWMPR